MAKVKTEKEMEEQVQAPVAQETEAASDVTPGAPAKPKAEVEIPETVIQILKLYPTIKELYVDAKGGVFTKDAPAQIVKGLTLYKNPYFKK